MSRWLEFATGLLCAVAALPVLAANEHHSPYAGQEKRVIKSLSESDIEQLQNGKGWGLAKAAELNGMPGPAHLLEMADEIHLTPVQREKIQQLFNEMKAKAIPLGKQLIEQERQLNQAFADKSITPQQLSQQLDAIAQTRKELRYVHLITHLATPDILSPQQIAQYNALRGYGSADPCSAVPQGHDPAMWKMHNNCP